MKNKKLLILMVGVIYIVSTASVLTDSGKAGKTNSPGESECSGCHNNSNVNTGGGSIVITSNMAGWVYTPGTTYQMTVTVSEPQKLLFGLGVEALKFSDNTNAGTLIITNAAQTHLLTASNGRINVCHITDGGLVTSPGGSMAFTFDWAAPATDIGKVTFYVAGIAAIGDGDAGTDNSYTTSQIVQSPSTVGVNELLLNSSISVSPNPVKDVINVSFNNAKTENVVIDLFSVSGLKVVELLNASLVQGLITKKFNIPADMPKGVYFLRVEQEGKVGVKRILIF